MGADAASVPPGGCEEVSMTTRQVAARHKDRTVLAEDRPGVPSIIEIMEGSRGALLTELRLLALALPGVEERTLYDGFCRHWTPAYYINESQLFHVHNFRTGLRATVFVGGKKLEPLILESNRVPLKLRIQLAKSAGQRGGSRQIKVALDSGEDLAVLLELVSLKRDCLQ